MWCPVIMMLQHLLSTLQATQLGAKWSSQLDAKLADQEHFYQKELAGALARLKGIESMVNTVANAGVQCFPCYPACMRVKWS